MSTEGVSYVAGDKMDVKLEMPIDLQLFVQTLLFAGSVLAGIVTAIPLGMAYTNLGSRCIMYGQVTWHNSTYFTYEFGHPSSCNFAIYTMVICCIMYPVAMGCYYGYATCKSRSDKTIASQMWVMPFILGTTLVSFLTFIAAIVISIGIATFCSSYLTSGETVKANIKRCKDAEKAKNFSANFFDLVTVSQSAAWIAVLIWVVQLAFTVLRFIRNRRLRSQDNFPTDPTAPDTTQIAHTEPTA